MTPSFTRTTPQDGTVLAFARDVRIGKLLTTVEVKAEWLTVRYRAPPLMVDLDQALIATGSGTERLPDKTATYDMVAVAEVTIAPLALFRPLLRSPFLILVNAWNLISARMASMGLGRRVSPFLQWLRAQTTLRD